MKSIVILLIGLMSVLADFQPEPAFINPYLSQELNRWSDKKYLIFCYNPQDSEIPGVIMTNDEFRRELIRRKSDALYYEIDVTDPLNHFSICPTLINGKF